LALGLIRPFFARRPRATQDFPAVTVLKPLHGDERDLLRRLSSFCLQDYPSPVQFVFGTRDAADPALGAVAALRRLHPEADITVVTDAQVHGPNLKVSNLINMLPSARHDVLIFADSDVEVDSRYLRHLVGELQAPGVGAVTCLYRGLPAPGFWPRLSANASNYQFLPSAITGVTLGLAQPCFGQTIGMQRETLDRIGGLRPYATCLAEDHAIGAAVRRSVGRVVIPPLTVGHACAETSFGQLLAHELRWGRTIRVVDPVGHLGSVLIHPFALGLLTVLFSGGAWLSWTLAAAALLVRLALKRRTDAVLELSDRALWLLPPGDVVAFSLFVASLFSGRVRWRGTDFTVDRSGRLSPLPAKTWFPFLTPPGPLAPDAAASRGRSPKKTVGPNAPSSAI